MTSRQEFHCLLISVLSFLASSRRDEIVTVEGILYGKHDFTLYDETTTRIYPVYKFYVCILGEQIIIIKIKIIFLLSTIIFRNRRF